MSRSGKLGFRISGLYCWAAISTVAQRGSFIFAFAVAVTATAFAAEATPHGPTDLATATSALQSPAAPKVTFRGTEYLLRSSHGNEYEFTPAGQEDLHAFTDSLTLNLYPAGHDEEALATITSRVRAIVEKAKGTILPDNSVTASGQQTDAHFFAAITPTSRGADFNAARFVLVDREAVGVFYVHRLYGSSATTAANEWGTKNASDVEQKLLQFDASRAVSSVKSSTASSPTADNTDLPAGTIKKGTLTSPQLIRDTMQGVAGKVATLGCDKIGDVSRYVVTPFSGAPRSRQWREKWLVTGCGKQYPVVIDFKEDGAGGAYWTIKN